MIIQHFGKSEGEIGAFLIHSAFSKDVFTLDIVINFIRIQHVIYKKISFLTIKELSVPDT